MRVENRWHDILATATNGTVVASAQDRGGDVLVRTRDGQTISLQVRWAGEGWPQDVHRAIEGVPRPWPAEVVLLARRLAPGAIERLRELGANWADETGQAHIYGPGGLIVVREHLERRPAARARKALAWSASAIDLAELVLSRRDAPLRTTALARESRWSLPQIANVLGCFDKQGWTIKRGPSRGPRACRELLDADGMLGSWATALSESSRASRVAHRATRDVMSLLADELAPALEGETMWALSGWAGLELAAPFATTVPSLHIYVAEHDFAGTLSSAMQTTGLREVDQGGRVTFWPARADTLDRSAPHEGVPVVSAPRLYADLISFGARGLDAAAHVKEQLIDPLHNRHAAAGDDDG
ncbi:MAG: type IV toxin-antitoxin system AbiEi family antitoxin [Solirubrobacteraceae bacterium]